MVERTLQTGVNRLCVYVTWHPRSVLTDMVLRQIRIYGEAGFHTLVVSNNPTVDRRLYDVADMVLPRLNVGHDFGAWKDGLAALHAPTEHLLLVNDSVCGPCNPLPLSRMLDRPPGVYGLTDCAIHRHHLQSYFLLFSGRPAIASAYRWFENLVVPTSKPEAIACEVRLSADMQREGHVLGCEFGTSVITQGADVDWLNAIRPPTRSRWSNPRAWDRPAAVQRASDPRRPLNPTHHLWLPLLKRGFPFIKRDLLVRNPGSVPGVPHWRYHWPAGSVVSAETVYDHLKDFIEEEAVRDVL